MGMTRGGARAIALALLTGLVIAAPAADAKKADHLTLSAKTAGEGGEVKVSVRSLQHKPVAVEERLADSWHEVLRKRPDKRGRLRATASLVSTSGKVVLRARTRRASSSKFKLSLGEAAEPAAAARARGRRAGRVRRSGRVQQQLRLAGDRDRRPVRRPPRRGRARTSTACRSPGNASSAHRAPTTSRWRTRSTPPTSPAACDRSSSSATRRAGRAARPARGSRAAASPGRSPTTTTTSRAPLPRSPPVTPRPRGSRSGTSRISSTSGARPRIPRATRRYCASPTRRSRRRTRRCPSAAAASAS